MKDQQTPTAVGLDDKSCGNADTTVASNPTDGAAVQEYEGKDHESDEEVVDDGDDGEEHEFEIIDQVESEEDEGQEGEDELGSPTKMHVGSNDVDDGSSSDDLDDSELHAMLEKGIDRETLRKDDRSAPIIKQKIVLKEFESDPFDILPEGWVCVTHNCGMPVYLHKESRVCTMARPYSLGSASARAHDIPLSAIPCLQYRRQLDKESVNSKPVTEEGDVLNEKTAREVSDCTENISVDVQQTSELLHQHNEAVQPQTTSSRVSLCPAATDPKPSPRKLWVVTQESFQKCPVESQKEALHTGTSEFSTIDEHVKLFKDSSVASSHGFPQSPEGDNIAVSFDSSSLVSSGHDLAMGVHVESSGHDLAMGVQVESSHLDPNMGVHVESSHLDSNMGVHVESSHLDPNMGVQVESSHLDPNMGVHVESSHLDSNMGVHVEISHLDPNMGVHVERPSHALCPSSNATSASPVERPSYALCPSSNATSASPVPVWLREMNTNCFHSDIPFTATFPTSTCESNDPCVTLNSNLTEGAECVEEGEIVEDTSNVSDLCPSQTQLRQAAMSSCEQPGNIDVSSCCNHVVREEVGSSSEPSQLVTSSSNSLATIKRKIESLKNKRAGKLRKLDSGGAAAWPTDNIAVRPLQMGIPEASNAAVHASANERLKLHAAEVKIKSAEDRAKESHLDSKTVHSYCSQLFQFRTLEVKKYRSWRERRRHIEERSRRNRPELPPSTKLITCPIPSNLRSEDGGENSKKREFILNPTGKSYLCILHEYMQRTLKIQPLYVFKELENSKTPYGATVTISNIEYGTGYASSKKVAKQEAAKETLKVLIPDLFKKISDQEIKNNISDLSFFDEIKVTDPRVNDLGNKVGQPSPFQLLLECLRRNFGMGNTQCEVSTKPLKNQKCEFTINVGKHSAMVVAKNKREGKQLAAQAILAKLHPHVPSWGSLLRLYGTSVEKPVQKPEDMNDIKTHAPNHSVLDSLRQEMRKLHQQKEAIQPKGKIIINSKNLPSKMSGVDL